MKAVRLLALVLAIAVVTAACSGDSVEDAIQEEAQSQSTGGDDTDDTDGTGTTDDSDTGDNDGTIVTDVTIPDSLPDIPGLSDECTSLAEFFLAIGQIFTGDAETGAALLDSAQSDLPDALDGAAALVAEAAAQYAEVLGDLGVDFTDPNAFTNLTPDQIEVFSQASESLSTPEVEQALADIEAYGTAECDNFGG